MSKEHIYLADLTHTGQIVASNVFPLGIGLIASYLHKQQAGRYEVELFKYPHDLNEALGKRMPRVIGFANYSWNLDLAYQFASRVKAVSPETVVVFGGPNYGVTQEEVEAFWTKHPLIDFYVVKEGEVAFEGLVSVLAANAFSVEKTKTDGLGLASCHYLREGVIVQEDLSPRLKDLEEIGSPYLLGLMDKFFDGVLIPMIHTTRGCPFTCTFCSEGSPYYSKVAQRTGLGGELEYIAQRRGVVQDIVITDANFGMYDEDKEKALALKAVREKYGWPNRVIVSTGKNKKEKIIEVAGILKGSMNIAASLQSTDATILKNINRSNISLEALSEVVNRSEKVDTTTYTELILGLPGDTVRTHKQSLRDVTSAGLGIVRMYQLILLPQTEMNTPATRKKYGIRTKFRINPRSFGRYDILGTSVVSIEHEEILVASDTLSFEDYLHCREMDLTVEILHNAGMFQELQGLCAQLGLSWFDFMMRFFENRNQHGAGLVELYEGFRRDSQTGLWDQQEALEADVRARIGDYLGNTEGTNEMAKAKAIAFARHLELLHQALYAEMASLLKERELMGEVIQQYLEESCAFSLHRKLRFIDTGISSEALMHFDFEELERNQFRSKPESCFLAEGKAYHFEHTPEQIRMIQAYVGQYGGATIDGIGRILMRAPAKRLFRHYGLKTTEGLPIKSNLTGLNVYGGYTV